MAEMKGLCALLSDQRSFTWNAKPTISIEGQSDRVDGLAPGERKNVSAGLIIERVGERVSVHSVSPRSEQHTAFFLHERHCFLNPTANPISDRFVAHSRARLLHNDLIEAAPGVRFRFKLRD